MPSAYCRSNKTISRNVSGTSLYFYFDQQKVYFDQQKVYFDQQKGEVPKTIKKLKGFESFFVDCSIIDAKLIFVTPTYGT